MPRTISTDFQKYNAQLSKEMRFTISVSFDTADTDKVYFQSHDDSPTPSGATVNDARVISVGGRSQSIEPVNGKSSIGSINIQIQDTDSALTGLIATKLSGGDGLRNKLVRVYIYYRGMAWDSTAKPFQAQIVEKFTYRDGVYTFNLKDVQFFAKKKIFIPKKTVLDTEVNTAEDSNFAPGTDNGTITVKSTADFVTVYHGTSWEDSPSSTVGYIQIDDEIIRYTGKTSTTFTGCTGGRLGTRRALHKTDTTNDDTKTKVEEKIYLDLPIPKLIYAILTGTIYGDAATLPDHWHLGISSALINTASFTNIGTDLWDTNDDTLGNRGRFKYLKPQDGKKFIEEQCMRQIGCVPIVDNEGQLSIKRLSNIGPKSSFYHLFDETNIISYGELVHDATQVYNTYVLNWNYDIIKKDFTRQISIVDANSQSRHQETNALLWNMYGIEGGLHSAKALYSVFDFMRQRYTGPPKLLTIDVLYTYNYVSVGDTVRVSLEQIRDAVEGTIGINQTFEVQRIQVNPDQGTVTLDLFGSSETPEATSHTADTTALDSGMYSTTSLKAANKLDAFCSSTYLSGSVLHIDSNNTFTGQATIPGATNDCVYWYDNDVVFDAGYTQTLTDNVIIMSAGFITVDCTIDGKGGSTGTGAAYFGVTKSTGGIDSHLLGVLKPIDNRATNTGTVTELPHFNIQYEGGTTFQALMDAGLPTDLRGSKGPDGGDNVTLIETAATGGAGGAGGAGLCFICQGIDGDTNGAIDLSGDNGSPGGTNLNIVNAGSGGGGAPGCCLILLDGSAAIETDMLSIFTAQSGSVQDIGERLPANGVSTSGANNRNAVTQWHDYFEGFGASDHTGGAFKVDYIQAPLTANTDNPLTTSTGSIALAETTNSPQTPAENLGTITVTMTPPSDSNFSHHNVYWKLSTEPDTAYEFAGIAADTKTLVATMDGTTYDIKAVPVSIYGIESKDYVTDQQTMSNTTGGVTLSSGNYIKMGQTSFDNGTGLYFGNDGGTPRLSLGNSAGNKVTWNGTTLAVTGTLTATTGAIGGWTIGSTKLSSTNITLDSSNQKIYIGGSTLNSAGVYADYSGGSGRLSVGDGGNNYILFDGTDFIVSSGAVIRAADSYQSDNFFIGGLAKHFKWEETTNGNGAIDYTNNFLRLQADDNASSDSAKVATFADKTLATMTFAKDRRFKIVVAVSTTSTGSVQLMVGAASNGFWFNNSSGHWYATSSDGTTEQTDCGAFTASTNYELEAIFTTGSNVKFYIDGVLKATHSTHIPSGTSAATDILNIDVAATATSTIYVDIGQFKFLQEA